MDKIFIETEKNEFGPGKNNYSTGGIFEDMNKRKKWHKKLIGNSRLQSFSI